MDVRVYRAALGHVEEAKRVVNMALTQKGYSGVVSKDVGYISIANFCSDEGGFRCNDL